MAALRISEIGDGYLARESRSGHEVGRGDSVVIHGCDTHIDGGVIEVYGYENAWNEDGQLHVTDAKRGGPGDPFGLGGGF